ncbi:MAG: sigma-70 family RNA polymerase sigma factor [Paenisporosarcina sp.]
MLSNRESSEFNNHFFFEDVVDQYGEELMRLAYTYVRNQHATEDIVQDVFMRAYEKRDDFRGQSTYRTYLYRMTINRCYDYLRSWYLKNASLSDKITSIFQSRNSTEGEVIINDERHTIGKEVFELAIKYREVLVLYYYKELSIEEIATLLKCSSNTIKTRLRRAREKLKVQLEKKGEL